MASRLSLKVVPDYEALSQEAFEKIKRFATLHPQAVYGLATGSTPERLYQLLRTYIKESGKLSLTQATSFNLDEYSKLDPKHPLSYHTFMWENLFFEAPFKSSHIPNGMAEDLVQECLNYDLLIKQSGGIKLQILGIGENGHIGFNEPSETWSEGTYVADLHPSTISANARFFGGDQSKVPTQAITMGIGSIMAAKQILIMASGANKAEAVRAALLGKHTPELPASCLQRHPNVTWLLDKEAASLIRD
ncbi:MAG: glucosamine-6-phosphate deaminase [Oscillospiraceae bacterium]|nr:glucosamine-6-phosphate deaminase [Oscillospiraceae bacterium]